MQVAEINNPSKELGAPKGWQEQWHGECLPLPVKITEDVDGLVLYESAWQFHSDDIEMLLRNGSTYLHITCAGVQPALKVEVKKDEARPMPDAAERRRRQRVKVYTELATQWNVPVEEVRAKFAEWAITTDDNAQDYTNLQVAMMRAFLKHRWAFVDFKD